MKGKKSFFCLCVAISFETKKKLSYLFDVDLPFSESELAWNVFLYLNLGKLFNYLRIVKIYIDAVS